MDPSPNTTEPPYVTLVSTPDYIIHNFRALQFHEQRSCLVQLQKIVQEATRAKIPCPECGKEFQGSSALGSHRSIKHQVYSSKKRRTLEQEEQQPQQVAVVEASSPELSTETVMHQSPFVVNIVNGRFSHISIKPPAGCQQWEIITPYSTTSGWPASQGNALPLPRLPGEQYWTFVSESYPQHQLRCLSLQLRGQGGEREHQTIEPTEGPTSVESPDWTIGAGEENESAEDEGSELAILRACPAAALGCAHHATTQADMWRHLDHCAMFLRARSVNWQRHCQGMAKHLQDLLLSKGVVKQEERALKEEPEVDDLPGDYMPMVFRHLRQQCESLASLIPPGKDDRMLDPIAEINAKEGMELESAQPQPAAHTQATTTSHSGRSSPTESESSTELLARPSSPAPDAGSPVTHQRLPHPLHTTKHARPTSLSIVPIAASPSSTPKRVRRTRRKAKKVVYCYFCGAEISCGGARKAAIKHIRDRHGNEIAFGMDDWVAKKEHPKDAPIFRSPKPGEQLFGRRHDTHWWWYPVEDWEVRQWEYVGPMPDDIAYRKGPPDPLPPGVERRPRLQVSLEERARYCGMSDKLHAQFIAQVARLVGDHCVAHPQQVARLLAALGYNRSEAQLAQIGAEARRVANIFLDNPSTPSDQLPTILHPFLTLVSDPGDVPQQDASDLLAPATSFEELMEWLCENL